MPTGQLSALTSVLGFTGSMLVAVAYVPQIIHLWRVQCTCSLSRRAWTLWLIASVLTLTHAVAIREPVFLTLTFVNVAAVLLILLLTTRLVRKSRGARSTETCR